MTSSTTFLRHFDLNSKMYSDSEIETEKSETIVTTLECNQPEGATQQIQVFIEEKESLSTNEVLANIKSFTKESDVKEKDESKIIGDSKKCIFRVEHNQSRGHKRRNTFCSSSEHKSTFKRKRRGYQITLPTKFLLGGNIHDPLNLSSLDDEEVSKRLNEVTPYSSPIPTPKHRTQVEVLIPPNINDPLNLNSGKEIEFNNLLSPKKRKKSRTNKKDDSFEKSSSMCSSDNGKHPEKVVDKIVSPVVPQGSPTKQFRRFNKSLSCEPTNDDNKNNQKRLRRPSKNANLKLPKFNPKNEKYRFGGYIDKLPNLFFDSRLKFLKKDWFENKNVLDLGCNVGSITLYIAQNFRPLSIVGVDIDLNMIENANKNIPHCLAASLAHRENFPSSFKISFGPLIYSTFNKPKDATKFPNNINFMQMNYVPETEEDLDKTPQSKYDTILCLQFTKWVHLNWGDDGLKRTFKKIFKQLKPGGCMLLEAHSWPSYTQAKKLTENMYNMYQNITFRPDQFNDYLLSKEVGFSSCTYVGAPLHQSRKMFHRSIYLFTKSSENANQESLEHSQKHFEGCCFQNQEGECIQNVNKECQLRPVKGEEDNLQDKNQECHSLDERSQECKDENEAKSKDSHQETSLISSS